MIQQEARCGNCIFWDGDEHHYAAGCSQAMLTGRVPFDTKGCRLFAQRPRPPQGVLAGPGPGAASVLPGLRRDGS